MLRLNVVLRGQIVGRGKANPHFSHLRAQMPRFRCGAIEMA